MALITPLAALHSGEIAVTACMSDPTKNTLIAVRNPTGAAMLMNRTVVATLGKRRGSALRKGRLIASSSTPGAPSLAPPPASSASSAALAAFSAAAARRRRPSRSSAISNTLAMQICDPAVATAAPRMPAPRPTTSTTSKMRFTTPAKPTEVSGCHGDLHARKAACALEVMIAAGIARHRMRA